MARVLKWLGAGLLLAGAGWSAWWYAGAQGQEQAIRHWLAQQENRGWQAEAGMVEVTGYPIDFRMEVRDLALTDPATGWSWRAPRLIAASKAWQPTRIAVTWPQQQSIAVPGDRATVRSARMDAVLDLRPGPAMELRELSGVIETLAIDAQSEWKVRAKSALVNVTEKPTDLAPPNSYDISVDAVDLVLPKGFVARLDPTGWLKPSVDSLRATGHAAFSSPLDRTTIEEGVLALRAVTIREAGFRWGDMELVVRGDIAVDDQGFPEGRVQVEAREWRQMIRLAQGNGVIDREIAKNITTAIEFVTALTGSGDRLSLPLGLSGGKVRIGPFAIAEAPRLAPAR